MNQLRHLLHDIRHTNDAEPRLPFQASSSHRGYFLNSPCPLHLESTDRGLHDPDSWLEEHFSSIVSLPVAIALPSNGQLPVLSTSSTPSLPRVRRNIADMRADDLNPPRIRIAPAAPGVEPPHIPIRGPGKTSPRLYSDILTYNPYNHGKNVLAELPPEYKPGAPPDYHRSAHNHVFILKPNQSSTSPFPVQAGARHVVAACCQECRKHVELVLHHADNADISGICPTAQNDLHHFRYDSRRSVALVPSNREEISGERDIRVFDCTNPGCRTSLRVTFKHRRVTDKFKSLLTDTTTLWNRHTDAFKRYPERFIDAKQAQTDPDPKPVPRPLPTPAMVLKTMRQAIVGVVSGTGRNIPRHNPRFTTHLGDECIPMLETLGFHFDGDELSPPVLPDDEPPWISEQAAVLDDWDLELRMLIAQYDVENTFHPIRADPEMKRLLGCHTYQLNSRRPVIDLTQPEHPMLASLGAQSDFSDRLLFWAYRRQKECDPLNAPYYLDCITDLANLRKSEDLQTEVAKLRSQGEITSTDIKNAYSQLNVPLNHTDENYIIGSFHSLMSDAPRQEQALRESLNIIGRKLNNQSIINVSKKVTMDIRQAYTKLGLEPGSDTDYIQNIFQLQLTENPRDQDALWEALKIIAETRKDHRLLSLCDSQGSGDDFMDYDTAMVRLGVNSNVSDENVIAIFEMNTREYPSQLSGLRAALRVIADRRNSRALHHYVNTGSKDLLSHGTNDWPVGLENIGNTCYLNSLLQYYFTVKPLRELVLSFEHHEEDVISEEVLNRKRVGGRKVTQHEIEQAKRFAHCLKRLFHDMVSSGSTYVKPEHELAELALNSVRDEPFMRKRSISWDDREPGFIGPLLPPSLMGPHQDETMPFSMELDDTPASNPLHVVNDDKSSEGTLVGDSQDPPPYEDQGYIMVEGQGEKENATPLVEHLEKQAEQTNISPTTMPGSDAMNLDEESVPLLQREDDSVDDATQMDISQNVPLHVAPPVPDRPPPVPPRPVQKHDRKISNTFSLGRQQDVTECIENVMFQLEAALKPEGHDDDGEQLDIIKSLFYGKTQQTLEFSAPADTRLKEERFQHLIVDVAEPGRDIYTALDNHFDASIVELEGKQARRHLSITALPAILQIQVQRVQFNRETKQPYKSNAPLTFGEKIFLDRYMATDDKALMARREQSWKWKEELERLERRRGELTVEVEGMKLPEALEATRMYLEEVNQIIGDDDEEMVIVPPSLLVELEDNKDRIAAELRTIDDRIKELTSNIAQQFTDLRKYGYRIHSIFFHKGTVNWGHYWIYIYDYQAGYYRKYNDGMVTKPVDSEEMYRTGAEDKGDRNPPNPYFLVYVRDDQTELMEAVCRKIDDGVFPGRFLKGVSISRSGTIELEEQARGRNLPNGSYSDRACPCPAPPAPPGSINGSPNPLLTLPVALCLAPAGAAGDDVSAPLLAPGVAGRTDAPAPPRSIRENSTIDAADFNTRGGGIGGGNSSTGVPGPINVATDPGIEIPIPMPIPNPPPKAEVTLGTSVTVVLAAVLLPYENDPAVPGRRLLPSLLPGALPEPLLLPPGNPTNVPVPDIGFVMEVVVVSDGLSVMFLMATPSISVWKYCSAAMEKL
ncbi:Ubiquitin carboxyl-terminal hydrolase [Drechslerella dactyloides]|uniref:ubiquitinyl hydrolase 1 n=1 Tax=Drechslerella dactyloides TaxID=74499 RepID=A0AAD6J7C3_DREDA|nr:Ubiquitin carboxyl-terminal hydrolase [Drechslerella dactyloides]